MITFVVSCDYDKLVTKKKQTSTLNRCLFYFSKTVYPRGGAESRESVVFTSH